MEDASDNSMSVVERVFANVISRVYATLDARFWSQSSANAAISSHPGWAMSQWVLQGN